MAGKVTDVEKVEICRRLDAGESLGEISKATGRGRSTVRRIALAHGWTPSEAARAATENAVRAHSAYSAERRATLAARFTEAAEKLLDQLDEPHLAFNFGGKDNTYEEHELPKPPVDAQRQLVQAAREAMRTVLDIDRHDNRAEDGLAAVDEWLRHLTQ